MSRPSRKLLAGALLLAWVVGCGQKEDRRAPLRLYAGAGLRPAVEELVKAFAARTGQRIEPDYGGSGLLVTRAREDSGADLFMPGDVWYVDRLHELTGRVESKTAVAWLVPVIIVARGNPKGISSPADFFREGVRVGLGKPQACQIGRISVQILRNHGLDPQRLVAKESLTVNELGVWVKLGDVDAAIVWDAIAANLADAVEVVEIRAESNVLSQVPIALMKTCRDKVGAQRFIDFVAGPEGQAILGRAGYRTQAP